MLKINHIQSLMTACIFTMTFFITNLKAMEGSDNASNELEKLRRLDKEAQENYEQVRNQVLNSLKNISRKNILRNLEKLQKELQEKYHQATKEQKNQFDTLDKQYQEKLEELNEEEALYKLYEKYSEDVNALFTYKKREAEDKSSDAKFTKKRRKKEAQGKEAEQKNPLSEPSLTSVASALNSNAERDIERDRKMLEDAGVISDEFLLEEGENFTAIKGIYKKLASTLQDSHLSLTMDRIYLDDNNFSQTFQDLIKKLLLKFIEKTNDFKQGNELQKQYSSQILSAQLKKGIITFQSALAEGKQLLGILQSSKLLCKSVNFKFDVKTMIAKQSSNIAQTWQMIAKIYKLEEDKIIQARKILELKTDNVLFILSREKNNGLLQNFIALGEKLVTERQALLAAI